MRIILIICILMINLQNCEQPKSNEDKMKSNYKHKPAKLIGDYLYLRTVGGKSAFGDPLCGGDPVGTLLGLNNDIPKPIYLEVGQTYNFEGNVNLAKNDRIYNSDNIFETSSLNNNTEVKITLIEDCLGQGTDGFYFNVGICNPNAFQYISNISNCIAGYSVLNTGQTIRYLKDDYQVCTVSSSIKKFFILIIENSCKYKIELMGV